MSRENQVKTLADIARMGKGEEARAMKRAMIKAMMTRGFIDDGVQDGTREWDKSLNNGKGGYKTSALFEKMQGNHKFKVKPPEADWKTENEDWYIDPRDGEYKMKYNDKTMNAMYEALFGDEDQEAMRMIAEEGEELGKKTQHGEYLRSAHFDPKAHGGQGGYVWSVDMAADGRAGHRFAASEFSKMPSRLQSQVAYHALMELSNGGEVSPELMSVIAKSFVENVAWMQERNPNHIAFGKEAIHEHQEWDATANGGRGALVTIPASFDKKTGNITEIDEGTYKRWENVNHTVKQPEVMAASYLRSTEGAMTGGDYNPPVIRQFVKDMEEVKRINSTGARGQAAVTLWNTYKTSLSNKGIKEAVKLDGTDLENLLNQGGIKAGVKDLSTGATRTETLTF